MLSLNMLSISTFEPWLKNHTCLSSVIYKPIKLALKTKIVQAMQSSVNRFEISTSKN